ncbi:flagellar filament capping protein FliD [Sulfuriferula nivalis]|uniref:Flagellar hook-associated protein 2 n=1 Tax=Sulfuriferula nivalis TaxID=2675298 RepID=A0A809SHJ9_9PROT|nr:flagellar filament capping protein FliD [Sulfuriferula nivalis]BBP00870.1 flagellar hook-associated protein 2 [Sulfuriferula nivalis]
MSTSTVASSTASGVLDVQSLVSQLMAVEQQPVDKLNAAVTSYQSMISSWGTISSLVSGLQTSITNLTNNLQGYVATPSDSSIFSASADSTAVAGTYSLNVTQLAQAQNLVATGQTSSTAAIGTGTATTITFDFGSISLGTPPTGTLTNGVYSGASFTSNASGTKSITIDSSNNSLQGIRDAINAANMGVTATIVNDGSGTPYRLTLTSNSSGASNSMKITTSGGDSAVDNLLAYDPAGTQNLNQTVTAQNANLTVNGIAITSSSNKVADAIQGVTLSLNKTTTSAESLTVARDTNTINTAFTGLVSAYNALATQLTSRSAYGTSTSPAGSLAGDGVIRAMQDQLRNVFNTAVTGGAYSSLAQVGIAFQVDGSLQLDSTALNNAITNNFSDLNNLVSSTSGIGTRLNAWATSMLSPGDGLIATRTASLNSSIKNDNTQIDQLTARLVTVKQNYITQYSNLNVLLGSMNATSSFLTKQLA